MFLNVCSRRFDFFRVGFARSGNRLPLVLTCSNGICQFAAKVFLVNLKKKYSFGATAVTRIYVTVLVVVQANGKKNTETIYSLLIIATRIRLSRPGNRKPS